MAEVPVEMPQSRVPVFSKDDAKWLFYNKMIVIIGDSVMRGMYKDLVIMLKSGSLLTPQYLRWKGEKSFLEDELIEGGQRGEMTNGRDYREVRQFQTSTTLVRFYFVTRVYNRYVETVLADFEHNPKPDIVLMGSCLWDLTRYNSGISVYTEGLENLMRAFDVVLSPQAMLIWSSALPVGVEIRGGVILENIKWMGDYLRLDVVMANFLAHKAVRKYSHDMIDFHSVFRHQVKMRLPDGIHWNEIAHRRMTFMFMDHVRRAWNFELPIEEYVLNHLPQANKETGHANSD